MDAIRHGGSGPVKAFRCPATATIRGQMGDRVGSRRGGMAVRERVLFCAMFAVGVLAAAGLGAGAMRFGEHLAATVRTAPPVSDALRQSAPAAAGVPAPSPPDIAPLPAPPTGAPLDLAAVAGA